MIRVMGFHTFDAFNEEESMKWIRYVIVGAGLDLVVEAFIDPMLASVGP